MKIMAIIEFMGCPKCMSVNDFIPFVSAVLIILHLLLSPKLLFCICLYGCIGRKRGMASVWTNQADRRYNMPKCDQERRRRCWKQGRTRGRKAERTWTVEKMEIDGAPDLTALTHSGLSLLASCALWFIRRGHTRTHIYLSMHAGDERILGLYVCLNVSAYQNMLKRMDATNNCICYIPEPVCTSVCVCVCLHVC